MNPNLSPAQDRLMKQLHEGRSLRYLYGRFYLRAERDARAEVKPRATANWLIDNGYVRELALDSLGGRAYEFTDKGRSYAYTKYGEAEGGGN